MYPSLSTNQAELLPYLKNICMLPNYSFKTCRVFIGQAMTLAGPARGQQGRSNRTSLYASGFWVQVVSWTGLEEGSRNELLGLPETLTTSRMALL